ncbi:MAG: nucleoside monophosphate kinase [Puniceicoccales bacterium]|nr:nucleoside monophosphate kinase [Puniceicoccales bacterium]
MKRFYLLLSLCVSCHQVCLFAGKFDANADAKMHVSSASTHDKIGNSMEISDEERAREIFDNVWNSLSAKNKIKHKKFPTKIIWLSGAPGSGKGTNTASVMYIMKISGKPIEVSSLLNTPEDRMVKASGNLVNDERVVAIVFEELLRRKYANGVVVDGFPRTRIQAMCLKLLAKKLKENEYNKPCSFKVINFTVSRKTSVARQLKRGQDAVEHNKLIESSGSESGTKVPVRETDLGKNMAEFRYQTYVDKMRDCLAVLSDMPEYCEISAEGDMETVRNRIYRMLSH